MGGVECLPLVCNTATPEESKHWTVISSMLELNWLYAAGTMSLSWRQVCGDTQNFSIIRCSIWHLC